MLLGEGFYPSGPRDVMERMEKLGVCSECGRPARYTCRMCGRLVCARHFDARTGLCTRCADGAGREDRPALS